MIPQNKNVHQLVWHLYIDTAVEGSELYCYNTESDRNSVVSQASWKMDVFNYFHIIGNGLWTLWGITLKIYEYMHVWYGADRSQ